MKLVETGTETRMLWCVRFCILVVVIVCVLTGCRNDGVNNGAPAIEVKPAEKAPGSLADIPRGTEGRPQPRLPAVKLWIGTNELKAEVARTMSQIMTGMMWRTNMAEMEAMVFVFGQPHRAQFWMRNTLLPLSCAYVDSEGTILELHDMKPRDESPIPAGSDQVQYVLEVNQGWFQRHNVSPGMLITTERGSLSKLFFGQ